MQTSERQEATNTTEVTEPTWSPYLVAALLESLEQESYLTSLLHGGDYTQTSNMVGAVRNYSDNTIVTNTERDKLNKFVDLVESYMRCVEQRVSLNDDNIQELLF